MSNKWGTLIKSCDLKDGSTLHAYRNGNMIYFVCNDKIEQSFHVENFDQIVEAVAGMQNEADA